MVTEVKLIVLPKHNGVLLLNTGFAGVESTTTTTLPGNDLQLFNVAITLYVPLYAVVAFNIVGFWVVLVNPELAVVVQL